MQKFPQVPLPPRRRNAKGGFLALCAIISGIYLIFSFALNAAHADPPTSPYTPGETLSPTCSPTSTNCTVLPPLFSTTTLPMGGILFMNDTSGTVTAATSSLYWNATSPQLQIGTTPAANTTGSLLLLGSNQLATSTGHLTGSWFGINQTTSTGADFLNFQTNSSTELEITSSGVLTANSIQDNNDFNLGTTTNPIADILYIATGSQIFAVDMSGNVTAAGNLNASGTITQNGVAVSTSQITTSSVGVANTLPLWTSGSALGDSFITQIMTANATSVVINFNTLGLPSQTSTAAFLYLGANSLSGGNSSGTYIGIDTTSTFAGDFINFQVSSSSVFRVASTGALTVSSTAFSVFTNLSSTRFTFTNATGSGNFQVGTGIFTTLASSTGITFTNATGSNNFQAKTGIFTTLASTTGLTFTTATGSGNLQVATFHTTAALTASTTLTVQATSTFLGRMAIGTSSFVNGSDTLIVCPIGACTASTTASTTNTVIWIGSTNDTAAGTSITAKGSISSGQADVGEYIPVAGDDSEYGQGEVLSTIESSSPLFGPSQIAYDPNVAGVVTITAGLIAGGGVDHGSTVIALAGRIPVNVTLDNGQIHTGDFLTSSNIPGVAMRATQPGRVIGMALADDLGDPDNPEATSQVMMLVNPGWNLGSLTSTAEIASSSWAVIGVDASGQPILDQFTAYVQAALAKLGVVIANGVATLQGIVANTVNTNELCVQGVCVNGNQLSAMINSNNTNNSGAGDSNAAIAPAAPAAPAPSNGNGTGTSTTATSTTTTSTAPATPPAASSTPSSSSTSASDSAPAPIPTTSDPTSTPSSETTEAAAPADTSTPAVTPAPAAPAPTPAPASAPTSAPSTTGDSSSTSE